MITKEKELENIKAFALPLGAAQNEWLIAQLEKSWAVNKSLVAILREEISGLKRELELAIHHSRFKS